MPETRRATAPSNVLGHPTQGAAERGRAITRERMRGFIANSRRAVTRTPVRSGSVRSDVDTALLTERQRERFATPCPPKRRRPPRPATPPCRARSRQIERQFGKGTVMRMGDEGAQVERRRDPHRRAVARPRARHRRRAARPHRRDLRPGVLGQDDARLPHPRRGPEARRRLRVHRRRARDGPALRAARSASTSTSCSSPSPTTASRRSRSPTCSCAPARSTSWRSTRSPRSRRAPSSRARWATRPSACRRG